VDRTCRTYFTNKEFVSILSEISDDFYLYFKECLELFKLAEERDKETKKFAGTTPRLHKKVIRILLA